MKRDVAMVEDDINKLSRRNDNLRKVVKPTTPTPTPKKKRGLFDLIFGQ